MEGWAAARDPARARWASQHLGCHLASSPRPHSPCLRCVVALWLLTIEGGSREGQAAGQDQVAERGAPSCPVPAGPKMVAVQNYHGNPAPPGKPVLTFQTGDVIELLRGDPESQWWEVGAGGREGGRSPLGQAYRVPSPRRGRRGGEGLSRGEGSGLSPGPLCPSGQELWGSPQPCLLSQEGSAMSPPTCPLPGCVPHTLPPQLGPAL